MVAEESKRLEKQTEKLESCKSKDEKLGDKDGRLVEMMVLSLVILSCFMVFVLWQIDTQTDGWTLMVILELLSRLKV